MRTETTTRAAMLFIAVVALISFLPMASADATDIGEDVDYDLVFPVDGEHHFNDTFWAGRSHGFHTGQDIMADKMTPVVAVADGYVKYVNWTAQSHMNPHRCCSLVIQHDDGWQSWYIHLDNDTTGTDDGQGWGIKQAITPGVRVTAGQHIAWVGDSGNAEDTAPHLHFELHTPDGVVVNPYSALVAAGGNDVGDGPRHPLYDGARVLKLGTSGYDVRVLQQTLNDLGYDVGSADASFGPRTEEGVERFQASVGLGVDGIVGRQTKTALAGTTSDAPDDDIIRFGSRGAEVRDLQKRLNDNGFEAGTADGIFGPNTLRAVLGFQQYHKLWVDGLVGPRTKAALGMM